MDTRDKFLVYLEKDARIKDAAQREEIADTVETKLPIFIRQYIDNRYAGIDHVVSAEYYTTARSKVFSSSEASHANKKDDGLYTRLLKLYAEFLSSKTFKGKEKVQLTHKEKEALSNVQKAPAPVPGPKPDPLMPSEAEEDVEGKIRQVNVTKHERNRELRQACLRHYGYVCQVCGMDFEKVYGEIGKDFIEVHHLNPISNTDGEHVLDPKTGLVPLCSNCHSMIHRGKDGTPFTLEEMKAKYKGPKWQEL